MLSDEQKRNVLNALYATASDPSQHERFVDEFVAVLTAANQGDDGNWLDPHIETASQIFEKLNFAGMLEQTAADLVEHQSGPASVINYAGDILAANEAWVEFTQAGNVLEAIEDEQDQASVVSALRSLNRILDDRTRFVSLNSDNPTFPVLSLRRIPNGSNSSNNPDRVLVRTIGLTWSRALSDYFTNRFEMSDVELETIQWIVAGVSLTEMAKRIGRTREAVKSRTKSIYSKLQVSGREDIVRLVLQLQNLLPPSTANPPRRPSTQDHQSIQLKDSRALHWTEKGAPHGRRLLFLHGLSHGHEFSDVFETLLIENDLTLLCLDRPGYGRSDPPRNWKKGLEEWIDFYPELAREMDIEGEPVIAHTGGILYATAAAAQYPELVSGICGLTAGVPIRDRRKLAYYPTQARITAMAARMSPSVLRFLIMNAAHYFRTPEGRERMIHRAYANGTIDSEALKDPKNVEKLGRALEMIADGGFDGYVSDNLHIFGDWSRYPNRVKCEIAYLNGTEDQICPIDWAREYAETLSNMTVSEATGAGYLMLYTHPERCMQHVLECLERFPKK